MLIEEGVLRFEGVLVYEGVWLSPKSANRLLIHVDIPYDPKLNMNQMTSRVRVTDRSCWS